MDNGYGMDNGIQKNRKYAHTFSVLKYYIYIYLLACEVKLITAWKSIKY